MEKRKPTYGSAVRMADLVLLLAKSWRPVPVKTICDYLGISSRTAQRYRKALNENLTSENDGDFLRITRDGGIEKWYLADQKEITTATFSRIVSVHVAASLLRSFKGTVLESGMKHAWEIVAEQIKPLNPSIKAGIRQLETKIRYSGFGRKSYLDKNEVLKNIVNSLINHSKLQILYFSHSSLKEKYYIIHPYTLLLHRDSLYLHAYVEASREIKTFSVDRVKEIVYINKAYQYPAKYNPDSITDGSFGIYEKKGRPFKAVIQFNKELYEYISTRRWHQTQKFSKNKNGSFTMEVRITNTNEFIPWILQFGKDAKVLEPETLKEKMRKQLYEAYQIYDQ